MKNFHVPLPDDLYSRLRQEAKTEDRSATSIAREAIERLLTERQREAVAAAVAAYARAVAGLRDDLDENLEAAAVERLVQEPP